MKNQVTSNLIMVRPANFGYNAETAKNNFYQQNDSRDEKLVNEIAREEFDSFVSLLEENGVNVIVIEDTPEPKKIDAIFPNNWFSTHSDGKMILYPMYAKNRRLERRDDIKDILNNNGFKINEVFDLTHYEEQNKFLEGTGSLILDRCNNIAYACRSQRTDIEPLKELGEILGYEVVDFDATQVIEGKQTPIYHTNVMMHLGSDIVIVCLESVKNEEERNKLVASLEKTGKVIIPISAEQKFKFAGNMLEVMNKSGEKFTVMSSTAYNSLNSEQVEEIKKYTKILAPKIETIEKLGGGSARCMMAEVFLPRK